MRYFRTLKEVGFIWNGSNSDPELYYKGKYFNYWDIEDALWDKATEDFGCNIMSEKEFNDWILQNKDRCLGYLDDVWKITPFTQGESRREIA